MSTREDQFDGPVGLQTPGSGEQHRSLGQDVWRQFKKHKGAVVSMFLLAFIVIATIFGPWLYGVDPYAIDTANASAPPSLGNPLGTDNLGRDVCPVCSWVVASHLPSGSPRCCLASSSAPAWA